MNNLDKQISEFLAAPAFAVLGASSNESKYGHRCYVCYLQNGLKAYPVNPHEKTILGNAVYPNLESLPEKVESISIITPPQITESIVKDAIAAGVKNIWMQPGAESKLAVETAQAAGLNVIYGGACILVVLGYHGH